MCVCVFSVKPQRKKGFRQEKNYSTRVNPRLTQGGLILGSTRYTHTHTHTCLSVCMYMCTFI